MALSVSFNSLEEVQVGIYNSRDVVEAEDSEFFFLSLSNDILRNVVNHNLLVLILAVYVLRTYGKLPINRNIHLQSVQNAFGIRSGFFREMRSLVRCRC